MIRRSEKSFTKLMKSKKKPSILKAVGMREDRGLMYYTGKKLKGKKLNAKSIGKELGNTLLDMGGDKIMQEIHSS